MNTPFRPDELNGAETPVDSAELAAALAVARLIERTVRAAGVLPTPGFSDRVMSAVATEAAPHRSRLAALAGVLGAAWRTALSANRPPLVRARAMAIVLVAVLAVGSIGGGATLAAAGALNLFGPHPTTSPVITHEPGPSPNRRSPEPPNPGLSPSPDRVGPSESPDPSETVEPSETPEPSSTDDGGGGSGGGGGAATPRPSGTHEPAETPEPSHTPEPSDH